MELLTANHTATATRERLLLVVDWTVDPHAVVREVCAQAGERPAALRLLVPAWLHGLDWVGDPAASAPRARRQVEKLTALLSAAGLVVEGADIGDPDPVTALADAVDTWPPDRVVLVTRRQRLPCHHPLDLVHRARRRAGVPVELIEVRR
jgi:hypothetical protein